MNKPDKQSSSIAQQVQGPTSVIRRGDMWGVWVADIKRGKGRLGRDQPINLHNGILFLSASLGIQPFLSSVDFLEDCHFWIFKERRCECSA